MLTAEQLQEVCPAVFGAHQWWWPDGPAYLTFRESTGELLAQEYLRYCRICQREQRFVVPVQAPA